MKYRHFVPVLLIVALVTISRCAAQSANTYLKAGESDPAVMGWMQGFPPPKDKILKVSDGSFFRFPALRYSVVHMREFLPTVNVYRGAGSATDFQVAPDPHLDMLTFLPSGGGEPMTWEASLQKNYTDGILILHRGKMVYERYFGALTPIEVHAVMSLTKSFTGTLASILSAEGKLDTSRTVAYYVPELKGSAFGDATLRQLMDMTTALAYSEDYSDPNAEIWQFSEAGNPLPKGANYDGPEGYYAYLKTVKKGGTHGESFGYKTPNADALGWVISKITGRSVAELLSEKIWTKLGMEHDAYYQVDGLGIPFAGGGLSAGLRDLGRFGLLMLNKGNWKGEQIIPESAVTDIMKGGSVEAFAKSDHPGLKGWSYRNMWWITENANGAYAARGVHGQTIYIDPKAEMVIVRLASHPVAANSANDPWSLPAYQAVADYLITR